MKTKQEEKRLEFLNTECNTNYTSLDEVKWDFVAQNQQLKEDFIREFANEVNWDSISRYQKLSEKFIIEFEDKVNWDSISRYQNLSEEFIRKSGDKLNPKYLLQNVHFQKLTYNTVTKMKWK